LNRGVRLDAGDKLENRRLVVLHVIKSLFSRGGTPRKLLDLVRAMDGRRCRHIFLVFGKSQDNLNHDFLESGAVVVEVSRPGNWDLRLVWDIRRAIRVYHVDIVCTHFARSDVYGALAGVLSGKPVIKNIHGILWNASPWLNKIDGLLSSFRACVVCNSLASLEAAKRRGGVRNGIVIYNGVPNRAAALSQAGVIALRASMGIPLDAFVVGHVGGLIPLRDQAVIMKALALVAQEIPNAYLVFIGDGPLRNQLEDQVAELGIKGRVLFLGYRDDVPELLAVMDAYVNMARAEGFGIAVVEAMQAGLPVVLANAGALPELIEEGVSGLLVPPGDSAVLARTLARLASDRAWAAQLGDAARQRAASAFSIERYARDFERLYTEVATRRHKG